MAEKNYDVPENPVYEPNIRRLTTDDPAHADETFNTWILPIINNIHAVNAMATAALTLAQSNAGDITELGGRVAQIEDSLFTGITANPFVVTFESLNGLLVTFGVWNTIVRRIEC